jgi:hypothetical protein
VPVWAVSTGRRNTLSELLCWRLILQGLAETFVKLPRDAFCLEWTDKWFLLANTSQKPVGVFVLIRVATVTAGRKVDINIRCQREARMICELFARSTSRIKLAGGSF